ncbi:MAG: NADH-quinone oxidoreductase subunit C [Desulfobacterales bacterium]|nr:NADH-quinone oxidoreductase subunit C [Desulfobacterales bacterium]
MNDSFVLSLKKDLDQLKVSYKDVDYRKCGYHLDVVAVDSCLKSCVQIFKSHQLYLVFVTAVQLKPLIQCNYQFAYYEGSYRIKLRVCVNENNEIPTISDIYHGAEWHERETHDFFGVQFVGHPYLEPLLLAEEDADLKPLLKDEKNVKSLTDIFGGDKV